MAMEGTRTPLAPLAELLELLCGLPLVQRGGFTPGPPGAVMGLRSLQSQRVCVFKNMKHDRLDSVLSTLLLKQLGEQLLPSSVRTGGAPA